MSETTSRTDQDMSPAVERALAQIPPLFPLSQFVAVNPFLGLMDESFEVAAERLSRLNGRPPLLGESEYQRLHAAGAIRSEDLEQVASPEYTAHELTRALGSATEPLREVLLTAVDGADKEMPERHFRRLVAEEISKWCAIHFDQNQTTWRSPWSNSGLYEAFRSAASHDVTPEIHGLTGFRAFVAELPAEPSRAVEQLLRELGPAVEHVEELTHRELSLVRGWSGYCRYLVREQELRGGTHGALRDLLAIRLAYDVSLLRAFPSLRPWVGVPRRESRSAVPVSVLSRWQAAYELGWQRALVGKLAGHAPPPPAGCPELQAVFCIDVRSEPLRRHLEATSEGVRTLGFAGFFGFAVAHVRADGSGADARCPALLVPGCESGDAGVGVREPARLGRQRASTWKAIQNAAASCFSFVETLGVGSAPELWSLKQLSRPPWRGRPKPGLLHASANDVEALTGKVAGMLKNMSLTTDFGRLLLLCGHGSRSANNPYASALDCGACGGNAGDVNARLAAQALNRADVRARLAARGLHVPSDTWALAGLHDTTTDEVELFDLDQVPTSHQGDLRVLCRRLAAASQATREERARSLGLEPDQATLSVLQQRATHLGEVRPEWGLAGNAALVVARRTLTRGLSLDGRCFLHEYRHEDDPDSSVLSLILSAPVVVASWINLQYYASRVDPEIYGSGNKVLHNVVGGIGVCEGNGGDLRVGLPLQSIHDGQGFVHEPRRLSVFLEVPRGKLSAALASLPAVKKMFDGGWIHLLAIDGGKVYRYSSAGFQEVTPALVDRGLAA